MDERSETNDATPETAAITGGVSPGAEPPPTTRGRASASVGSVWLSILLGAALIVTALVADQESEPALGTAIAGAALLAIGLAAIAGLAGPVTVATLGFAASILLTVLAFADADIGIAQLILLVAGAAMFISSFASLAASRRPAHGGDEPRAGVENV